jgi:phosphatidylserine decarboxylase
LWGRLRPGNRYSALVGFAATRPLPSRLRAPAYRAFARAVGADVSEAELELDAYPSLGEFFARRLRPGARTIDRSPRAIISPCDGVVAAIGTADAGTLVQAKGRDYELAELLADDELAARLRGGVYATIYLSPRDYHRVHAPVDARVVAYDYVPGALWPVNPKLASRRDRLLSRNERVVIHLDAGALGKVALVMVGASGVGNIWLGHGLAPHGARASSSRHGGWESAGLRVRGERRHVAIEPAATVARGDELAAFHLGSTVVLVFEPGAIESTGVGAGDAVRLGAPLATSARAAADRGRA